LFSFANASNCSVGPTSPRSRAAAVKLFCRSIAGRATLRLVAFRRNRTCASSSAAISFA
jgi:hypothetical protein